MAESRIANERIDIPPSSPDTTDFGQDVLDSIHALSQPVEMSDLSKSKSADHPSPKVSGSKDAEGPDAEKLDVGGAEVNHSRDKHQQNTDAAATSNSQPDIAIGPATDGPTRIRSSSASGPQLMIVLLLHSTQTRHPYIINEKYLRKRNISVADNDPVNMSVYTLKELIWRDWREGNPYGSLPYSYRANAVCRMGNTPSKPDLHQANTHGSHAL